MILRRAIPMTALLFLGLATGCAETIDSGDVGTDGIYAEIEVLATGNGTSEVVTTLKAGGNSSNVYVDLTEHDSLIASANDAPSVMSKEGNVVIRYHSTFPTDAADTAYKVSFLRSHAPGAECNGISAPDSHVTLPAGVTLTGPAANATFSRTSPITVTWSGSGEVDPLHWSIDGDCILAAGGDASDTGTLTIPANALQALDDPPQSCTVTLTLGRSRSGAVDPAYGEGGTIVARQVRSVSLTSTP